MPVNDAEGDEVGLADSEPPGVDATDFAVVGVEVLLVVVVVFDDEPDATVVVGEPLPVAVVVVVVELPVDCSVVVVVPCLDVACVCVVFLEAEGLDEPHAAAIRPPARTTAPIENVRPMRRRPCFSVGWGETGMVCKIFLPHSSLLVVLRAGESPRLQWTLPQHSRGAGPEGGNDS